MANRLATETSPYLLQHADNPVDWYPWGGEALSAATRDDKPIFLSIGYSACHWCHVMEQESFENRKIAELLNQNFVCIKVDREERPDLDQIYMDALLTMRHSQGGWPLNVFLTPQQEFFFGGTYWPPTAMRGMPGFDQVLLGVLDAFQNRREQVAQHAAQITEWLNRGLAVETEKDGNGLDEQVLADAVHQMERQFDFRNGGFGSAPKFPHAPDLSLLIGLAGGWPKSKHWQSPMLTGMVQISLRKMADGGIFDHLAGGFARYSVDAQWLVPHFEKMLYDNAMLARVYLEMFQAVKTPFFETVARATLDYVRKYMTTTGGAICSSEDADSEGEEGKFYVWSKREILETLGADEGNRFCQLFGVTEHGNFEGQNILFLQQPVEQFARLHGLDVLAFQSEVKRSKQLLLQKRDSRVRPGLDDKVLVSWNALAISSFAFAARVLDDADYERSAVMAVRFILDRMRDPAGRLSHTWRNGTAKHPGFLDDYAFMLAALIELYLLDFDATWLEEAEQMADMIVARFSARDGGLFLTPDDHENLIARPKADRDSSIPSGSGAAAASFIQLGRLTGNESWSRRAESVLSANASSIRQAPLAYVQMLIALQRLLQPGPDFLAVAPQNDLQAIQRSFHRATIHDATLVCYDPSQQPRPIFSALLSGKTMVGNKPTLYECRRGSCGAPIVGLDQILARFSAANGNV
jgi:hypothetical protein